MPFSVTVKTASASLRNPDDCDWRVRMETSMRGGFLTGTEIPFAKRRPRRYAFAVPSDWALEIEQTLRNLRIPAAPEFLMGCDGGFTELWTGDCAGRAHYRWWSVPPDGWEPLDAVAQRILDVFHLLREDYDVRNDRHAPRLLMECPVVGMSHIADIAERLAQVEPSAGLCLAREPENEHDPRAVAVLNEKGERIGYIPRTRNVRLAGLLDCGRSFRVKVTEFAEGHRKCPTLRIAIALDRLLPEDLCQDGGEGIVAE